MDMQRMKDIAMLLRFTDTPKNDPSRENKARMALNQSIRDMEEAKRLYPEGKTCVLYFLYVTICKLLSQNDIFVQRERVSAEKALAELLTLGGEFSCVKFERPSVEESATLYDLEEFAKEVMKLQIDEKMRKPRRKE